MRILLAEDDHFLARGLVMALEGSGYNLTHTDNGAEADRAVASGEYDLLILDLGLPEVDGLEVLRRIRQRQQTLPVLILTARHSIPDRVRGLDLGANDYLAKPFDLSELEARIRVLLRKQFWNNRTVITHGDIEFETTSQQAKVAGKPIDLTARETKLLEIMLQNSGRVVTKQQLADRICNWEAELTDNAIDILMHRLRKKLSSSGLVVRTIRGLGYMVEKHG
jgi:two-component system OmpR family response regulator